MVRPIQAVKSNTNLTGGVQGSRKTRMVWHAIVGAVCAVVIGVYAWSARSGWLELWGLNADNSYYNLLAQGFRAGQLNVNKDVPPGLAQLADPYDPKANHPYLSASYRLLDLSFYKGKLYLYFGVTPTVVLFWPCAALTGHYLLQKDAVAIFLSVGFLACVSLLGAVWRRYFTEMSLAVVGAGALALGLASSAPLLLAPCDVYEVAISCGYALAMVALLLLWQSMHTMRRRAGWLAGASLAYGLAVGARPSLLPGAVILLAPVALAWRDTGEPGQRRHSWPLLLAATGPILAIGLGLMVYNFLRFQDPFEFGWSYQLCWNRQDTAQGFNPRYLWFNFWVYFLEPAWWNARFPFVHDIVAPRLPAGHLAVQHPFGVLTNMPLVWLALGLPLVWRGGLKGPYCAARSFGWALALLFGMCALTLCLFFAACLRYELEFLPVLVLLAVLGSLGLERALAGRRTWLRATRWGCGLLLVFSVVFNLLAMSGGFAESNLLRGKLLAQQGQPGEAVGCFKKVLQLQPDNAEAQGNLGTVLFRLGKAGEAVGPLEHAVRLLPDSAEAHDSLGLALSEVGRVPEAIEQYELTLRLKPDWAEAHNSLGLALAQQGKLADAVAHWRETVRLDPQSAEAHYNVGLALAQQGYPAEALNYLEQAVRLDPESANGQYNLGTLLVQQGKFPEAEGHLEQALRLKPDLAQAHYNLGLALSAQGRTPQAVDQYEHALRLKPQDAGVLNSLAWVLATSADGSVRNGARAVKLARKANELAGGENLGTLKTLAAAYAEAGRFWHAVKTAQAELRLAKKAGQAAAEQQIQMRLKLYKARQPYRTG